MLKQFAHGLRSGPALAADSRVRPLEKPGGVRQRKQAGLLDKPAYKGGTGAAYLVRRMKRDHTAL